MTLNLLDVKYTNSMSSKIKNKKNSEETEVKSRKDLLKHGSWETGDTEATALRMSYGEKS